MTTQCFVITTALAGCFLPNDAEPFEATTDEAIAAFLDEAIEYLDDATDLDDEFDEDSLVASDRAFVESLRGHEGRGDIAHNLTTHGVVSIMLQSPHNEFGASITLAVAEPDPEPVVLPRLAALLAETPPWETATE